MFHPTGNSPKGKTLICMEDVELELDDLIDECEPAKMVESITKWLDEKGYCVECWQMKEYLKAKGMDENAINEDMAAAAPAPAPGLATLGNVSGMGNPAPPSAAGATNAGFYNPANQGSGDKFTTLTVGTPAAKSKKGKMVASYLDFIKKRKKKS
jgi:hypothetical protein